MDGVKEGVIVHRVSIWFSLSLSTWVPVNPPPPHPLDSQLDTPAPSEWLPALALRNFPPLSVSKSWLEITACCRNTALHLISNLLSLLYLSHLSSFLYLLNPSSPPLQCHQLLLTFFALHHYSFSAAEWRGRWRWVNGEEKKKEREIKRKKERKKKEGKENLPLLSGARMMSWGHLSSWCGGFPSSANYLVQTRIWYGGYEAQIQLLWANKEILRFREWGRDHKWDRRRAMCTVHARAQPPTHAQTQPLVLPLHSLR